MTGSVDQILKALASEPVTGMLAIGGIITFVTATVRYFQPPDSFASIDWTREQWSPEQSRRYFDEKERFERLRASGSRGFGNSMILLFWLILLILLIAGGPVSGVMNGQTLTIRAIMVSVWVTLTIIVARWVGYRWRRCKRYLAFIDGDEDWMASKRPKT